MKIVAVLLILHGIAGNTILVNPELVTSMQTARPDKADQLYTDKAVCLISTSDGKNITVIETCDQVKALMEQVR